jgi:hypothetical protein
MARLVAHNGTKVHVALASCIVTSTQQYSKISLVGGVKVRTFFNFYNDLLTGFAAFNFQEI